MATHTPGEWTYDPSNCDVRTNFGDAPMIAEVWSGRGISQPEMDANGRLIAAGPRLLSACKGALLELSAALDDLDQAESEVLVALRDAIRKAEGDQ